MSNVELKIMNMDFVSKRCTLVLELPSKSQIHIHRLDCNPPGDQTESELRKFAIEAALDALKEVIESPPA